MLTGVHLVFYALGDCYFTLAVYRELSIIRISLVLSRPVDNPCSSIQVDKISIDMYLMGEAMTIVA